jgi:UDP-glucose 4-epimerase
MAFGRLIDSALNGTEMSIFGDGGQTRDFTYVSDVVAATIAAGEGGAVGAVYNVGGGSRMALTDAIRIITSETGAAPNLVWTPHQRGDARDTAADTSRIAAELGFAPEWDVASGLSAQVAWHRAALGVPSERSPGVLSKSS